MKSIFGSSQTKINKQKPLVSIYWDSQNVPFTEEKAKLMAAFANSQGRLISGKVYYNSKSGNHFFTEKNLGSIGFTGIDVPCPLKNAADDRLMSDYLEDIHGNQPPDVAIIVSGDGDFKKLVLNQKKLSKKAIVVAQRGNVKQTLKIVADDFHFVDELPNLVSNKAVIQKDGKLPYITYNDAVNCFMEAIKTAVREGRSTTYSIIASLMCQSQRFPNYKGVSTIHKPDGTKFSSFKKFVAAVVKQGKIKLQNEEILLV
ncbi:NYN domain-containing protein [Coleofasciculus sp. FACHB-64]|uniref:NYN domain-containing protein n=1 Tax=Cyanophyceae TaxID=3028117 RepID=UPI001688FC1C|nr:MULTISPECIES: NYN domain-containing protein [unclassified Coleofasciculus]MBD1838482.1 NYN domain-containing protein [Coleofasciculus sp. FACHB-501]MBD2045422.1 NYN domain-containing protein [Coleofasciculus sp. FACHB-64]